MHTQQLRKRIILWEDQLEDLKTTGSASDFFELRSKINAARKNLPEYFQPFFCIDQDECQE
ncbi:MAG TPA: hypothetical protein P5560_14000 [Thermotogota bacterium]|mgnify:CR=1 FL=1|nr:hypothetical protein [Thermotogota bacterium]